MYKAFNLEITKDLFSSILDVDYYSKVYLDLHRTQNVKILKCLDEYLLNDEVLSGKFMMEDWFPEVKADVFLSHSHMDLNLAHALAGFLLKRFNLSVFVDSVVWGYSDELLKKLDNEFCSIGKERYSYSKRNNTTAHVHMMLSTALLKMIDKTECLFFLNTNNSNTVQFRDYMNGPSTYSPWIFSEISIANSIRRHNDRLMVIKESAQDSDTLKKCAIAYPLEIKNYPVLNNNLMYKWYNKHSKEKASIHSLDSLYNMYVDKRGKHYAV